MRRILAYILLLWVATLATYAQPSLTEGKQLIEDYMARMSKQSLPGDKQYYFAQMKITSVPGNTTVVKQGANAGSETTIRILMGHNKLYYESEYLCIYQDAKDVFTVVHPRKQIVRSTPKPATGGEPEVTQQLTALNQEFLKVCRVEQYKDVVYEGKPAKMIVLVSQERDKPRFKLNRVTYYYNQAQDRVVQQINEYIPGYKFARQTITYQQVQMNYRGKVSASARACIYKSSKKVLDKYQGYQLEAQ